MSDYRCSHCGAPASYDGRCGDGPYLTCSCVSARNTKWVNDGRGGYTVNRYDAKPIPSEYYDSSWDEWPC